jgi:hypothetical protein
MAYDVFYDETEKKYKSVILTYDPVNQTAEIKQIAPISRSVGMSFVSQKTAIRSIVKIK